MRDKLTLYVCHIDDGGPPPHACRRAQRALREAGHEFDKVVHAKGHLFGLFTKGRRPQLKAISGQEQLPVLRLPDGATINRSAAIIAWAKENAPDPHVAANRAGAPRH
jgi:glutathione S-transferase